MIRTFRLLKIIWWYKISKMCQTFFCWNAICRLFHFWNSDSKIVSDVHPMSEGWRIIQSCQICDVFVVVFVVVADVVVQAEQTITKNACVRTRRFQALEKYWKWKKNKNYWTKKLFGMPIRSYHLVVTNLGWGYSRGWLGRTCSQVLLILEIMCFWKQVNLF